MIEKEVNLLFVGKNGGCFVIIKVVEFDNYLHAYYNLQDYIERDIDDFYFRSEEYNPKPLKINSEIKSILDSIGVKYNADSPVVHKITYRNERGLNICDLHFIENEGKLYFKLVTPLNGTFILTPERFRNSFAGMEDDLPPMPQEEFEELVKQIIADNKSDK